jgi:general secretion pathway protein A
MAGKPFEYEAPMSARAPIVEEVAEPVVVSEPEVEVAVEEVHDEIVPVAAVTISEPEPEPEAISVFHDNNAEAQALTARLSALEQRVGEQEAALRRVLAMMIDWMNKEQNVEARFMQNIRAA